MKKKYVIIFFLLFSVSCIACWHVDDVRAQEDTSLALKSDYLSHELALENNDTAPLADLKLPSIFQVLVRFFFSLLIIIGLVWATALLYNKYFGTKYFLGKDTEVIKILTHRYLDPKKSIYIIEVAQRIFVLAAGTDSVNVIAEITDPNGIQRMYNMLEVKSEQYGNREFKNILAGFVQKGQQPQEKAQGIHKPIASIKNLQSHIQKLKRLISEK